MADPARPRPITFTAENMRMTYGSFYPVWGLPPTGPQRHGRRQILRVLCVSVAAYAMGRSCKNADMKNAMCAMLCGAALFAAACSGQTTTTTTATKGTPASGPTLAQLPDVDMTAVLAHTRTLSSDEFEGRAPGTPGERRTVDYLVSEFTKAGLKPGNTDGTFIQKVPLVGITPVPAPLVFKKGARQQTLKWNDDVVAWTKHVADSASLDASELVFVGYGVVAPEYNWDDYKGMDVKGKTLVMLGNDPAVPDPSNPNQLDPKTFGGKAMTYY